MKTRYKLTLCDSVVARAPHVLRRPRARPEPSVGVSFRVRRRGRGRFGTGSATVWDGGGRGFADWVRCADAVYTYIVTWRSASLMNQEFVL